MKHIFVVNPRAGGRDRTEYITERLKDIPIEAEVYATQAPRDATCYAAARCREAAGEPLRLYACGGDGTLNEVTAGVMQASDYGASPLAVEVGCFPCGSGNDYIKNWPTADFGDLRSLVEAPSTAVDVMRLGERCCINVMNFGFEAEVCRTMNRVRRWPLLGGKGAYVTGIVHSLLHAMHHPCRIAVDGEAWQGGDMLLGSAACGRFVGGGYQCAPRAVVDDGLLEVLCVESLNLLQFAKIIGLYKKGEHLDHPELARLIHYRRGRRVVFESDRDLSVVVDGELLRARRFEVECHPQALKFIVPQAT